MPRLLKSELGVELKEASLSAGGVEIRRVYVVRSARWRGDPAREQGLQFDALEQATKAYVAEVSEVRRLQG